MRRSAVLACLVLLCPAAASAETYDRTVKGGARSVVGSIFTWWEGNCHQAEIPEPKLRSTPKSGTVQIERHTITMPSGQACAGRQLTGPVMFYTPAKGFRGADEFSIDYDMSTNDNSRPTTRTTTYRITVQ